MAFSPDPKSGFVALNRFGYGARGDGNLAAASSDPRGFLKAEIAQPGIALLSGPDLKATPPLLKSMFEDQERVKMERAKAADAGKSASEGSSSLSMASMINLAMGNGTGNGMDQARPDPKKPPSLEQQTFRGEAFARIQKAVDARAGLAERLVAFWSNHFCISARKSQLCRMAAGSFEREAIRPHVFGHFADMLKAVEQHPAMLAFLDNQQSVGPNSKAGQNRKAGLNENLAREIMELHTMGVGSGYTQGDVTALARMITGWTFAGREGKIGEPGTFVFNGNAHEPGDQMLMGKAYMTPGLSQGEAALNDIARHPATAKFIATRLAQHFIADVPPKPLVDRLTKIFRDTDGDLKALVLALIDADESWSLPLTKMRSPYEYMVVALRLQMRLPDNADPLLNGLNLMGMPLWQPPGPNGWPDSVAAWASPEGMKQRLDVASMFAQRWKDLPNPSDVLVSVAGDYASDDTRLAIARAESRQQGMALLLMSPEIQRR